uniref:Uncharacterized protein n=1 Tax=Utricularia reniformis TaxID=192314 RepID=A0A1Y0B270_9LAMI|nr:hypothetical protein AEK19_MT1237 [Utricularia reniformis]ART31449.1 hypothetical protein AEK19_MT1237 [Utricularia reniformis]
MSGRIRRGTKCSLYDTLYDTTLDIAAKGEDGRRSECWLLQLPCQQPLLLWELLKREIEHFHCGQ